MGGSWQGKRDPGRSVREARRTGSLFTDGEGHRWWREAEADDAGGRESVRGLAGASLSAAEGWARAEWWWERG